MNLHVYEKLNRFQWSISSNIFPQIGNNDMDDNFLKIAYHPFCAPDLYLLFSIMKDTYHFQDRIWK